MKRIITSVKQAIKDSSRKLGLEVSRYSVASCPDLQIASGLKKFGIDLVIDVGANSGQYSVGLIKAGYSGQIISFEPLVSAYLTLEKKSRKYKQWKVYERCAVGGEVKEIEMNISGNSVSSSICKLLPAHLNSAPDSSIIATAPVKMIRLDEATIPIHGHNSYLKIDTQGYESKVLDGAEKILNKFTGIQLELSLVELYEGQKLWRELHDRLVSAGFKLWVILPGFTDPNTGQTLQFDGIFFRNNLF